MKSTVTAESEAAGGPNLSVVAEPSPEEVLKARIAELEKQNAELSLREASLTSKCAALVDRLKAAIAKIKALEKNPLTFALSNLDAGAVLNESGDALNEVAAQVLKYGKKGSFSLSLIVKPWKEGSLLFLPEVKTTLPKPEPKKTVLYRTEDGAFTRNDPSQKELWERDGRDRSGSPDFNADEELNDPMLR